MIIKIGRFEFTEVRDGVLYKNLSDYPNITDWELQTVLDFIAYEENCGRSCVIEAEEAVAEAIERFKAEDHAGRVPVPEKLTECTACPKYGGCMTDLVCHTYPMENAVKILDCGSLLSPVKARGLPASELKKEKRNAANDPEDYFSYIMFAWGNCQAGDRLVVERRLGRFPIESDLAAGFEPGVRFFFRYDVLCSHPKAVHDGVLPLKIEDEVALAEWVHAVIVPELHRAEISPHIPDGLKDRVHFLDSAGCDIWEWSERVYEFAKSL